MTTTIHPDYLVIGAGAVSMAFVDTLITDTKATIAIVDRYSQPGGHWTMAYPFVTLHQPSVFYGVNSRPLGEQSIDQIGLNKGLSELATGDEILAYFKRVMHRDLLPTGRVKYYPMHEYMGEGLFRSLITNETTQVGSKTRIVDGTLMKVQVPAMRLPPYEVAEDVALATPDKLTNLSRPYGDYTIVGAGKTGVDVCIWLLGNGVDPKNITWIMPRDAWFVERSGAQPLWPSSYSHKTSATADDAIMAALSQEDLFERLEASGRMLRIDENVRPTMVRCAIISAYELEQIRRVKKIVRQGRVTRIRANKVSLERGTYTPEPNTLYIDCTADGLAKLEPVPVFSSQKITLQPVRHCQQVFSAAFIAHVEVTYDDDEAKNALCSVITYPEKPGDFLRGTLATYLNGIRWYTEPRTAAWLT